MVLSRQNPDDVGDEQFAMHMDGSAWKELWAALREERGDAPADPPSSTEPPPAEPETVDIFREAKATK